MVTAWDVYWVMQLGSISSALFFVSIMSGLFGVFGGVVGFIEDEEKLLRPAKKAAIVAVITLVIGTVLPSSKTAAAMILVPKLTSPAVLEPIGAEAKELYGLAKDALRKLGDKAEPEKSK